LGTVYEEMTRKKVKEKMEESGKRKGDGMLGKRGIERKEESREEGICCW
jgi:hypothetical protein